MTQDSELAAMTKVADALKDLEPGVIDRVLRWANDRYLGTVAEVTSQVDPMENNGRNGGERPVFDDFPHLFDAADPQTAVDKALVAAYWFQVVSGDADLDSFQLNRELRNLGHSSKNITRRVVDEAVEEPIDYVFASEPYGWQLADVLEAAFVPVDLDRELVPVSATRIRRDPLQHWNMLPDCVRPYYLKRVCLIGPESTGKSTLARDLSRQFNTTYVWEYARPLLNPKGGRCEPGDIDPRFACSSF